MFRPLLPIECEWRSNCSPLPSRIPPPRISPSPPPLELEQKTHPYVSWISVATEQSICARHRATSLPLETGSENGVANALSSATRSATKPVLTGVLSPPGEEEEAAAATTAVGGEARSRRCCCCCGRWGRTALASLFETIGAMATGQRGFESFDDETFGGLALAPAAARHLRTAGLFMAVVFSLLWRWRGTGIRRGGGEGREGEE